MEAHRKAIKKYEKNKKVFLRGNSCSLFFHLGMTMVGLGYNCEEHCSFDAPLYLVVAGGIMSTMHLLIMLANRLDCVKEDDEVKIMKVMLPLVAFTMVAVGIWGSVVIFGPYSTWNYETKSADNYCEYYPFMLALAFLITGWILLLGSLIWFSYSWFNSDEEDEEKA